MLFFWMIRDPVEIVAVFGLESRCLIAFLSNKFWSVSYTFDTAIQKDGILWRFREAFFNTKYGLDFMNEKDDLPQKNV